MRYTEEVSAGEAAARLTRWLTDAHWNVTLVVREDDVGIDCRTAYENYDVISRAVQAFGGPARCAFWCYDLDLKHHVRKAIAATMRATWVHPPVMDLLQRRTYALATALDELPGFRVSVAIRAARADLQRIYVADDRHDRARLELVRGADGQVRIRNPTWVPRATLEAAVRRAQERLRTSPAAPPASLS